ncbi:MAG: hypothetical protein ABJD66_00960 [Cellulophaga sp.]|uniref:hypothetical protein n=1 Tax=unclassified Cellulophaga TaxID=2634405 RepID=UPI000CB64B52|nr:MULTISPECIES: hypothetical protein [unclassified Cellulophaga]MDO6492630.1 hypothetical protein [Cellulophaga sp. 2_MG-2023]MDO6495887.1 hypothetical protein [Cellulophaga sp. 3_MG-2023]PKB43473.1 hypothetical protein AX016_1673 [Cellulophaga sp. RHA19]|eukprot:TRINITY_DN13897_c0_g1_i1.p1 TRINITY_DN13897_c0_g1~~TRINITY_DN13897_c0_g1_i1.p1  ORF type:complete len:197 (-),score=27.83 TRINITY_DN13897_c0_g1_i1:34-624(-)
MKTIFKISALVLFLFVSTASFAAEESSLELVTRKDSKDLVFKFEARNLQTVIKFVDQNSAVFYSEQISDKPVYSKKFNVESLEDGNYFLNVENMLKKVSYAIHIKNGEVVVDDKKEVTKPIFQKRGDLVVMSFLNKNKGKVLVSVFDLEGNEVYTEVFNNKLRVEKAFRFTNFSEDEFRFVVEVNKDRYSKLVSLD